MSRGPPAAGRSRGGGGARGGRGQAHALEGVVASLVLLSAVVFALQMTAVTPLSASTSSQHLENQQRESARGILGAAAANGSLEPAVLYWSGTAERFHGASDQGYYTSGAPETAFGRMLGRSFDRGGVAYNVRLSFADGSGGQEEIAMVYQGEPSDNAVSATRTVVLLDDAQLLDAGGEPRGETVRESSRFYAPDADSGSVYNVIRVEVVVWRI
ncbi:DUF7288 family protein [Halosimplex carlsbadense]|uniref:DUF7288 family protein n=1 Tax=Halosimplex carlsbadense TaxID=171164 RepID=UPI0009E2BC87|nr:hypothetical protein [Halosimplex carlsbadense]